MLKKTKMKYLRALRGKGPRGEYRQGFGSYTHRTPGGQDYFCALGVMINETCGFDMHDAPACGQSCYVTYLCKELGITTSTHTTLVELNDYSRKSFAEIADWIEENI